MEKLHRSSRRFIKAYGRIMLRVECLLMLLVSLIFILFSLFDGFAIYGYIMIAFFLASFTHSLICIFVSNSELFPRESLFLDSFRRFFFKLVLILTTPAFMLLYVIVTYFPLGFWSENLLFDALVRYAAGSLLFLLVFYFYPIGLISKRTRLRLSLRSALIGLKLISGIKKDDKRRDLIEKYVKWAKKGFESFRIIYKKGPVQIEISDIDEYYQSLCCTALIGRVEEIILISGQLRRALRSVHRLKSKERDDIRQFLISLKNVKNLKEVDEYDLSELREITRMLSRSDRARKLISSPFAVMLVGIIPITLQVLSMLKLV